MGEVISSPFTQFKIWPIFKINCQPEAYMTKMLDCFSVLGYLVLSDDFFLKKGSLGFFLIKVFGHNACHVCNLSVGVAILRIAQLTVL